MGNAFAELQQRELLRTIVHEARNPLAAALYSTELVNRNLTKIPNAPEALSTFLGNTRLALHNVESILSQIGRVARTTASSPAVTTLGELIAWWSTASAIETTRYSIIGTTNADIKVIGQVERLAICLEALLSNAVTAHAKADVTAPVRVIVGGTNNADRLTIAIEDDGAGIADDILPQLFKSFVSDNPEQQLGLGLKVARDIATEYGGEIVLANVRAPTRFELRLQLASH